MAIADIVIDIAVRAGSSGADIDAAAGRMDKFKGTMGSLAAPAGVALGAIGGLAAGAVAAASEMQQATGGVNAVFGDNAAAVQEWAKTSAQSVGLAGSEYKTMAAGVGGALTGMGVPMAAAATQTNDLITRAADLASVFGGDTKQATEAVTSAFRGEYDSLQRLIPSISGAAIEQEIAAEAAAGQTFASEEAAKASAIYNTIMGKSADSAGNFAKEADTAAGAQERAQAQFKDTAAALGEQLLPAVTTLMTWLSTFGQWVSEHIPLVTTLAAVIGGVAVAVLAINAAMAVYSAVQTAAAVATGIWSAAAGIGAVATTALGVAVAVLTSPITLIIAAIAALIAIVVLLVKNWDTVAAAAEKCWQVITDAVGSAVDWIKEKAGAVVDWLESAWSGFADFLSGIWDGIKSAAGAVWDFIKGLIVGYLTGIQAALDALKSAALAVWEAIKSAAVAVWSAIKSAAETALNAIMAPINAIKAAIDKVISGIKSALQWASQLMAKIPFIGGLFSSGSSAPSAATRFLVPAAGTPSLAARGLLGGSARGVKSGRRPEITVNGALDPVAVARQIRQLLLTQERRTGAVRV